MSNKLKNIISNLIGLGVIALGTVTFLENDNLLNFVSLLTVGLAAFLFKGSETLFWIRKILSKSVNDTKSCNHNYTKPTSLEDENEGGGNGDEIIIIGDMPDPDKEEK